jgi:hypothetical protein
MNVRAAGDLFPSTRAPRGHSFIVKPSFGRRVR